MPSGGPTVIRHLRQNRGPPGCAEVDHTHTQARAGAHPPMCMHTCTHTHEHRMGGDRGLGAAPEGVQPRGVEALQRFKSDLFRACFLCLPCQAVQKPPCLPLGYWVGVSGPSHSTWCMGQRVTRGTLLRPRPAVCTSHVAPLPTPTPIHYTNA